MQTRTIKQLIGALIIVLLMIGAAKANPYQQKCDNYAILANILYIYTGVPPSVQMGQAICETGLGSDLAGVLVTEHNNVFAIRWYKGQYYPFHAPAPNWNHTRVVEWRKYPNQIISWIDHAIYMTVHHSELCYRNWIEWEIFGTGYGRRGYWRAVGTKIRQYKLWKYDWFVFN